MEKYEQLKKVIQEANPDKFKDSYSKAVKNAFGIKGATYAIRLSDVMITIEKATRPPEKYMVCTNGIITFRESKEITAQVFNTRFLSTGVSWNLYNDNLDHQSDEIKLFLIDLLAK